MARLSLIFVAALSLTLANGQGLELHLPGWLNGGGHLSGAASISGWPFDQNNDESGGFRDEFGQPLGRVPPNHGAKDREPLDIDYVEVNANPVGRPGVGGQWPGFDDSSSLFQHTFGNYFPNFNGWFPGYDFNPATYTPWYRGANVCVNREEDIEDWDETSPSGLKGDLFASFQVNFESCVEKQNKHVCKTVSNHEGRKRTVVVTRQCCHGYGRIRTNGVPEQCTKLDLFPIVETAEKLGAKEFIRSAKNNGLEEILSTNVTVFMPSDAAVVDFSEHMFESNLVVLPLARQRRDTNDVSGITMKELALNHIVDGWIHIEDIENEQLIPTKYENSTIRINIFPQLPSDTTNDYPYRFTANCAPLTKINKLATNGIIHLVDRVMLPVTKSLMELVRERADMTVLRTVLEKTDLSSMLEDADKTLTLFAPTDKAFEKLEPSMRRTFKEGSSCALNILKAHILMMTFCSSAISEHAKTHAFNLLGQRMIFDRVNVTQANKSQGDADELADLAGTTTIMVNNEGKVTETDKMATNGVLHVIDTILPTESGMPISSLLTSHNLTIFKQMIEDANLLDEFDSLANVTFFAPTDKAFMDYGEFSSANDFIKNMLQYHVAKPLIKTCDLSETMLKTESQDNSLRVNLYATHPIFSNVLNRATINCARIVHFDDESCGSILHQIDKVLEIPTKSLTDILTTTEKYSKFLTLVREANLTDLLNDSSNDFTLLVPSNDVFAEVSSWYDEILQSPERTKNLVRMHILPDVLCCAGIVPSDWPFIRYVQSLNLQQLNLNKNPRPSVGNAGIVKCDIIAKNGVVHEINEIISDKQRRQMLF